jgi:hypothetical protein
LDHANKVRTYTWCMLFSLWVGHNIIYF